MKLNEYERKWIWIMYNIDNEKKEKANENDDKRKDMWNDINNERSE